MILIAILTLGSVALVFGTILAIADVKLQVIENPKISEINEILPQANCGACGLPGCKGYAAAIVHDDVPINKCAPGGQDVIDAIASIMGLEAVEAVRNVARVHCRGDEEASRRRAQYTGIETCKAAALVGGGDKHCEWGCLGYGDCVTVCTFDAIAMGPNGLPTVDEDACTGCKACVDACPRGILELHPITEDILVFCRSHDGPKQSRSVCSNACIACWQCVRKSPQGAVDMDDNLARVLHAEAAAEACARGDFKCPTKAIGLMRAVDVPPPPPQPPVQEAVQP
ncbi:MAG TPA: RnfABCDGE type electron transport complex subunit B [Thermoanaerobaculia bacterium]|nr:RnfABCDGE type electron transport complex subunit B [Thermoanaerobaculia bacterium]HUM28975.1 RnfABCDGE type electron transport complex subunit B [Thermoanaerobaculia bacterium]HXK67093.1 RnfABCDGE type electron transport complex subunit B [Thermoanaerobaculia bacterium]